MKMSELLEYIDPYSYIRVFYAKNIYDIKLGSSDFVETFNPCNVKAIRVVNSFLWVFLEGEVNVNGY